MDEIKCRVWYEQMFLRHVLPPFHISHIIENILSERNTVVAFKRVELDKSFLAQDRYLFLIMPARWFLFKDYKYYLK